MIITARSPNILGSDGQMPCKVEHSAIPPKVTRVALMFVFGVYVWLQV